MRISLFTPTHNPRYLLETYLSFKDSSFDEWIVVANGACQVADIPAEIRNDPRVSVHSGHELSDKVGAVKRRCCELATGDILVEVDHDDLLVDGIVEAIRTAFEANPEASLVHSDWADFNHHDWSAREYGSNYGWVFRDYDYRGHRLRAAAAPPTTAHTVCSMYYGPNHVRAFRRTAYEAVGGHKSDQSVADDMDLVCRLYCWGPFVHLPQVGYIYRVHGGNTWLARMDETQARVKEIREYYLRQLIEVEAKRAGGLMIDLGGRFKPQPGYLMVDRKRGDPDIAMVIADLNGRYPFADSSVMVVRAADFLEHVADKMHSLSEIHRILKPGGYLISDTPSTTGPNGEAGMGADQDPTHVSRWNRNAFWYVTNHYTAQFIDNTTVKFMPLILQNEWPNDFCKENGIPYVRADLMCIKGDSWPHGAIDWPRP